MKVLVTGGCGQLGIELSRQLDKTNHECLITDRHSMDISNHKEVTSVLNDFRPDAIINCASFRNVDECELNQPEAFRVNSLGARNLSCASYNLGAKIVQVSTDYVFDGRGKVPLRENDAINPLNIYGESKALGEILVKETNPRHFIVRTAWMYGEGSNFIRTILKLSGEMETLRVVDDQVGSPTSVADVAECILDLISTESYGTYHATCEGQCSWFELAKRVLEIKGIKKEIAAISTDQSGRPAKRPKYTVLDNFMLKIQNMDKFRHWETALEDYLRKL